MTHGSSQLSPKRVGPERVRVEPSYDDSTTGGDITWTFAKRCTQPGRCGGSLPIRFPTTSTRILDAAIRAPTGGNAQNWRFLLVDDPEVHAQIGPIYRRCIAVLWESFYADRVAAAEADPDSDDSKTFVKVRRSAQWLADNFEIYPLLLFSFVQHDPTGGSIYPATWSAMLTARAEGVGSSLTSVLLFENDTVLDVLGVPSGEGWLMSSCVTFGYPTGRWGVAARRPAHGSRTATAGEPTWGCRSTLPSPTGTSLPHVDRPRRGSGAAAPVH